MLNLIKVIRWFLTSTLLYPISSPTSTGFGKIFWICIPAQKTPISIVDIVSYNLPICWIGENKWEINISKQG